MKSLFVVGLVASSLFSAQAEELAPDGKLKALKQGDVISAGDTIGGYPIFTGGAKWTFFRGGISTSSRGTPMANLTLSYSEGSTPIALQFIDAAIASNDGGFWTGSPCSGEHLVVVNKGRGREDHCLTISPGSFQLASGNLTVLNIRITNTASNSRLYNVTLQFRPDAFGWRGSNTGDWTKEAVAAQPMRAEFVARLTAWAEKLLDANMRAIDFSKPQNVYDNIPSALTLLPTYEKFAHKRYSLGFLSMIEDVRHRTGYKALAFSHYGDYKTRSGSYWGAESQEDANMKAIAKCEDGRPTTAPVCTLFAED